MHFCNIDSLFAPLCLCSIAQRCKFFRRNSLRRYNGADTGLHNSWVRNNGTTQHNFCWFHCWVPINPHQLMFIKGWVPNISNQQLCNQQLVSIWSAWLLGTQLLGCAAFDPTLDQTFQILSLFVELVSKI